MKFVRGVLRLVGRLHLFLDTSGPRDHHPRYDARKHDQMKKDAEWEKQVGETVRAQQESRHSRWFNR